MKIGIVITAKNLINITKAAVASIQTKHEYHLILIDDFSSDGTYEWMQTVPNATAYRKFIASLAGKWNLGARTAWDSQCELVLICNNDILFHPVTIDALVARMEQGEVGMVTGHSKRDDSRIKEPTDIFKLPEDEEPTEAPHPDFSCFLLSKETWDIVGEFDEKFIPCYFEDNDYHYRMVQAGLLAVTTTSAPYFHYMSLTQNSIEGGMCPGERFRRNREYFLNKHGVDPDTYLPVG